MLVVTATELFRELGRAAAEAGVSLSSLTHGCRACDGGFIFLDKGGVRPCMLCNQAFITRATYSIKGPTDE